MAVSDPIADLLTRIRNACAAQHRYVDVPLSKIHLAIVEVMKDAGFIQHFLHSEEKRKIRIFLKYAQNRKSVINGLRKVSKPGVRKYVGYSDIPSILGGLGIAVVSTPQGVMSGEKARSLKVGGELICSIW